jgi:hypothetical protein
MPSKTATTNGVVPAAAAAGAILDLDTLLAERRLDPAPVVLDGHTYHVRRDLTRAERMAAENQAQQGTDESAVTVFAIIFGKGDPTDLDSYDRAEAERFIAYTDGLPEDLDNLVKDKILVTARLITEQQLEARRNGAQAPVGESTAS